VVAIATRRVLGTVPVGWQPNAAHLSPDGNTLLVANGGSNDLAVVDTSARALTDLLPLELEPRAIAVLAISSEGEPPPSSEGSR
jgi:YVTN family beta-propeller protein